MIKLIIYIKTHRYKKQKQEKDERGKDKSRKERERSRCVIEGRLEKGYARCVVFRATHKQRARPHTKSTERKKDRKTEMRRCVVHTASND